MSQDGGSVDPPGGLGGRAWVRPGSTLNLGSPPALRTPMCLTESSSAFPPSSFPSTLPPESSFSPLPESSAAACVTAALNADQQVPPPGSSSSSASSAHLPPPFAPLAPAVAEFTPVVSTCARIVSPEEVPLALRVPTLMVGDHSGISAESCRFESFSNSRADSAYSVAPPPFAVASSAAAAAGSRGGGNAEGVFCVAAPTAAIPCTPTAPAFSGAASAANHASLPPSGRRPSYFRPSGVAAVEGASACAIPVGEAGSVVLLAAPARPVDVLSVKLRPQDSISTASTSDHWSSRSVGSSAGDCWGDLTTTPQANGRISPTLMHPMPLDPAPQFSVGSSATAPHTAAQEKQPDEAAADFSVEKLPTQLASFPSWSAAAACTPRGGPFAGQAAEAHGSMLTQSAFLSTEVPLLPSLGPPPPQLPLNEGRREEPETHTPTAKTLAFGALPGHASPQCVGQGAFVTTTDLPLKYFPSSKSLAVSSPPVGDTPRAVQTTASLANEFSTGADAAAHSCSLTSATALGTTPTLGAAAPSVTLALAVPQAAPVAGVSFGVTGGPLPPVTTPSAAPAETCSSAEGGCATHSSSSAGTRSPSEGSPATALCLMNSPQTVAAAAFSSLAVPVSASASAATSSSSPFGDSPAVLPSGAISSHLAPAVGGASATAGGPPADSCARGELYLQDEEVPNVQRVLVPSGFRIVEAPLSSASGRGVDGQQHQGRPRSRGGSRGSVTETSSPRSVDGMASASAGAAVMGPDGLFRGAAMHGPEFEAAHGGWPQLESDGGSRGGKNPSSVGSVVPSVSRDGASRVSKKKSASKRDNAYATTPGGGGSRDPFSPWGPAAHARQLGAGGVAANCMVPHSPGGGGLHHGGVLPRADSRLSHQPGFSGAGPQNASSLYAAYVAAGMVPPRGVADTAQPGGMLAGVSPYHLPAGGSPVTPYAMLAGAPAYRPAGYAPPPHAQHSLPCGPSHGPPRHIGLPLQQQQQHYPVAAPGAALTRAPSVAYSASSPSAEADGRSVGTAGLRQRSSAGASGRGRWGYGSPDKWIDSCLKIIRDLKAKKSAQWFLYPVEPESDGVPDYFDIIHQPMDFMTIEQKLKSRAYSTPWSFQADARQVFYNAFMYHLPGNEVWRDALRLARAFEAALKNVDEVNPYSDALASERRRSSAGSSLPAGYPDGGGASRGLTVSAMALAQGASPHAEGLALQSPASSAGARPVDSRREAMGSDGPRLRKHSSGATGLRRDAPAAGPADSPPYAAQSHRESRKAHTGGRNVVAGSAESDRGSESGRPPVEGAAASVVTLDRQTYEALLQQASGLPSQPAVAIPPATTPEDGAGGNVGRSAGSAGRRSPHVPKRSLGSARKSARGDGHSAGLHGEQPSPSSASSAVGSSRGEVAAVPYDEAPDNGPVLPPPAERVIGVNDKALSEAHCRLLLQRMSQLNPQQRRAALVLVQDDLGILAEDHMADPAFSFDAELLSIEKQKRLFAYVNSMVRANVELITLVQPRQLPHPAQQDPQTATAPPPTGAATSAIPTLAGSKSGKRRRRGTADTDASSSDSNSSSSSSSDSDSSSSSESDTDADSEEESSSAAAGGVSAGHTAQSTLTPATGLASQVAVHGGATAPASLSEIPSLPGSALPPEASAAVAASSLPSIYPVPSGTTGLPLYTPVPEEDGVAPQIREDLMGRHADFLGKLELTKAARDSASTAPLGPETRTAWPEWKGQVIQQGINAEREEKLARTAAELEAESYDAVM
eukprot:GHVT01017384.1.p1 GENE.GHVT01017384.1~~GHVT01017384.1.p1  ORF type:complete len:1747 (-),score=403.95 GHVT01017384.1:1969-7209(-)